MRLFAPLSRLNKSLASLITRHSSPALALGIVVAVLAIVVPGTRAAGDNSLQDSPRAENYSPFVDQNSALLRMIAPIRSTLFSSVATKLMPMTPLVGPVTVAGSSGADGDYASLTKAGGAFAAINAAGSQAGNGITITVSADVTTEDGATSLNDGGWTTLTITPSGARTLSGSVALPLINLNGAKNVTIDGLNASGNSLTISNLSTAATAGTSTIRFINDASNDTITNCTILGSTTGTAAQNGTASSPAAATILLGVGVTTGNDSNTISNNNIGPAGANLPVVAISSAGQSTGVANDLVSITGNNIFDFYGANGANGIAVGSNSSAFTITNNKFYETASRSGLGSTNYWEAIFISTASGGGYTVNSNTIGFATNTGTGMLTNSGGRFVGIDLTAVAASPVSDMQGNTINGINWTTTSGAATAGAAVINGVVVKAGLVNIGNTTANVIGATSGVGSSSTNIFVTSTGSGTGIWGIYVTSTNGATISGNTVGAIATSGTPAIGFTIAGIQVAGTGSHTITNNTIGNGTANNLAAGISGTTTAVTNVLGIVSSATGTTVSIGNTTGTGNTIQNLSSFGANGGSGLFGIQNTGAAGTVNINFNTLAGFNFAGTGTTSTTIYEASILNSGAATTAININNNTSNTTTLSAATFGGTSGFIISTASGAASAASIQNNSVTSYVYSGATGGTSSFYGVYHAGTSASLNVSTNAFNNLTLKTSGGVILCYLNNATTNVTVSGNTIGTQLTRSVSSVTSLIGIYSIGGTGVSSGTHTISNNNLSNVTSTTTSVATTGVLGILWEPGTSATSAPAVNITGNTISTYANSSGSPTTGIVGDWSANLTISGNTVSDLATGLTTTGNTTGIQSTVLGTTANVFKNRIYNLSSASTAGIVTGISVVSSGTSAATTAYNIYNNLIGGLTAGSSSGTNQVIGVSIAGPASTNSHNLYFNTIYLSGSGGANFGTSAVSVSSTPTVTMRNNILVNACTPSGTGASVAYRRSTTTLTTYGSTSNNNDFYAGTPGATRLIFTDGTNSDQTIAAFKTRVNSRDALSLTENPPFLSTTGGNANFLKINTGTPTQLESGAVNISGITDDFENDIRQGNAGYAGGGTAPDVGADEFNGVLLDLSGPVISYTALGNGAAVASRSFTGVTITDATGVNTTAGTKPRLYYRKSTDTNDLAATGWKFVEANGATSPFDFTINYSALNAGSVSAGDTIQYFVVAQDTVATPNVSINSGLFAAAPSSVALTGGAFPITGTINSYGILTAINGTKTVCASGCDFTTLTGAAGIFNAINTRITTSNIEIQIAGDLTTGEDGTNGLNPLVEEPSGSNFTVKIYPTGTTRAITGTNSGGLIRLNAADRVTIDGSIGGTGTDRSLTMTQTNSGTSSAVVWMQSNGADGATNNTIKNCNIIGNSNTTTLFGIGSGSSTISITSTGTVNNSNTIQNNNLSKTQYGIFSEGASAVGPNTANVITQNLLNTASPNNIGKGGILVGFERNILISLNVISGIANGVSSFDSFGISLGLSADQVSPTTSTGNSVVDATVDRNTIGSVTHTNTYSATGIAVAPATSGTNRISNNMIYGVTANSTSGDLAAGIFLAGGTGSTTQVYGNSISMTGDRGSGTTLPSYGIAVAGSNPTVDIRDNIFFNTQTTTGGGKSYAIGLAYTTYTNLTSDYNDLFTSGAQAAFGQTGGLGTSGTDRTTLALWQAQTSKDPSSKNVNPLFSSLTDLHLTRTAPGTPNPLEDFGVTIAGVTNDFDNDTRANPPDIGADEVTTMQFSPASYLVAEDVAGGLVTITVTRTTGSGNAGTVAYATSNGSAVGAASCGGATNYVNASGVLNFAAADTSKTFTVAVCDNGVVEGDKTVNLTLSSPTGSILGSPFTAVLTITNVDVQTYTLTYTAGANGSITGTSPQIVVQGADGSAVTAVPDPGYTFWKWSDNSTQNPRTDTNVQANISVTANFLQTPVISTYHAEQVEGDSGTKIFKIPVFRAPFPPSSLTSTVDYTTVAGSATPADDYVTASGTLTFNPGDNIKYISVTVNGDTTPEPDETFTIHLSSPTNATIGTNDDVSTIVNDDTPTAFVVTKTADTNDGVCNADCSLREAMSAANASVDLNPITFNIPGSDPNCSGGVCTITLGATLPNITHSVYIDGPGADALIVNGGTGNNQIFHSNTIANVRVKGMTLESGDYSFDQGGAIYAISPALFTLDGVLVRNNTSGDDAGGISFWQGGFEILNSTVSGNSANNCGGMKLSNGELTITNSTFSGNTATAGNGFGGGACFYGDSHVTIRKSTFANNTAGTGGGGGVYNNNISSVNIGNSVVAGNTGGAQPDIFNDPLAGSPQMATSGYNLIGKNDGAATIFPAGNPNGNNDIAGTTGSPVNALLGALAMNGGTTPTHKPDMNSPAIDKGSAVSGVTTDQRGFTRPYDNPAISNASGGDGSDIGAVEVQSSEFVNDVVFNGVDADLPGGNYHDVTINGCAPQSNITLTGNVIVTGTFTINDCSNLYTNNFTVSGSGAFVMNAGTWLHITDANGITSGTTLSGNIQNTGGRTFPTTGNYDYDGNVNQVVGNGLPGTVNDLLISNSGGGGNKTVTGASGQIVTSLLEVVQGVYSSHSDYNDVQIDVAGTLSLVGNITVSGNWTNNGIFLPNGYGVTFDGSSAQTIGGSNNTQFALVTINNPAGVTVTGTASDINALTLTNGTLSGANNFTVGNSSEIYRTGGSLSGTPVFAGPVSLIYPGSSSLTTGTEVPAAASIFNFTVATTGGAVITLGSNVAGLNGTLAVSSGVFDQGATFNVTSATATVANGAIWRNLGTGDLTVGAGGVSNAGTITFDANGAGCGPDDILIRSSVNGTQRAWSGAGTFTMSDVDVKDQAGTALITVMSGTNSGNNGLNWVFVGSCAGPYTWTGSVNTDWTNPLNWSPARVTPAPDDILNIGISTPAPIITNVAGALANTNQTIAELHIAPGVLPNFSTGGGANTLTIDAGVGNTGLDAFALAVTGSNPLTIKLASGTLGHVDNNMSFAGGGHRLIGQAAGAISIDGTASFSTQAGFTGNAFGDGSNAANGAPDSVRFHCVSGNCPFYIQNAGGSPFGAPGNSSVVTFEPGSTTVYLTASGFDASGRSYSNLTIGDNVIAVAVSATGGGNFHFDNLYVNSNATTDSSLTYTGTGAAAVTTGGQVIFSTGVGSGSSLPNITLTAPGGITIDGGAVTIGTFDTARSINLDGNVLIATGTTVTLQRIMQLGLVNPNTKTVTVDGALDGSATGYVIGSVLKNFDGVTTANSYPVGTANGYSPLDATNTTGTGTLTVSATGSKLAAISGTNALSRYWTIASAGVTQADLKFQYNAADVVGTEANYKIFKYNGSFTQFNPSTLDTGAHFATLNGVTSFSDWTLAEDGAVNPGTLAFVGAPYSDSETNSDHVKTITVSRAGGSDGALDVTFQTSDGTAMLANNDYAAVAGNLHWNAGETGDKTFGIPIKGDTTYEADETVNITLSNPTDGATITPPNPTTLTILNDDAPAATLVVNTTDDIDNGACLAAHCSLREAINAANYDTGDANTIAFNIPLADPGFAGGVFTIQPASGLPTIRNLTTIDGTTQTTFTGDTNVSGPEVLVNGSLAGPGITGLFISGDGNTVKGLVVNGFAGGGLAVSYPNDSTPSNNQILDNYVGTNATGTAAVANAVGIDLHGSGSGGPASNNTVMGNLISGNTGVGLDLCDAAGSTISNNRIGTDASGTSNIANGSHGVALICTSNNDNVMTANTIAFNSGDGIFDMPDYRFGDLHHGNKFTQNSIFENTGIGINLLPPPYNTIDGVTPNDSMDPDTGANGLQNFPVITSALVTGMTRTITGTLNTNPSSASGYTIEFFSNATCDGTNGEGKTYLGSVSTSNTDANGDVTPFVFHPATLLAGDVITATATDSLGNTSEFSACFATGTGSAGTISFTSTTYSVAEDSGPAVITVQRTSGSAGVITATFDTSDGTATTANNDYTPVTNYTVQFNDGDTTPKTINIPITADSIYEGDETVNLSLSTTTINRPGQSQSDAAPGLSAVLTITNDDNPPTTLVVNTTADTDDGLCSTGPGGCTLREAIAAANFSPDTSTITFDSTVFAAPGPYTINLTGALPDISTNMSIVGPGATVLSVRRDTGGDYRIFTVGSGVTAGISGLTITNGNAVGLGLFENSGGGIFNNGTQLDVTACVITGNIANVTGSGQGGGLFAQSGTVNVMDSTVSSNSAGSSGGGLSAEGGGATTVTVTNSTVSGNSAVGGGGVASNSGVIVNITGSTISANSTSSGGSGGGIINGGPLTITNSTVSGNMASGYGGGIYLGATATLTSVTVTNNHCRSNNDTSGQSGGLRQAHPGTTLVRNSIVSGNYLGSGTSPDDTGLANGHFDSNSSFNLIGVDTTGDFSNGVNSNQVGVLDPGLGALANNGGPTQTHAVNLNSTALDKGASFSLTTDQRGQPRPVDFSLVANAMGGDGSDIGAFERQNTNPTITATTGLGRQQGSPVSNSQIATVNDAEDGPGGVTVTVNGGASATVNGVTVSNIVNTAGNVTADIVATCSATNASFTLTATDGNLATATDTLTITVTANPSPVLSYSSPVTVTDGNPVTVNPATGPSDNGSIASIVVQSVGTYTGGITVNNSTGVVSLTNAAPVGSHTITIRITDNCGMFTDATFTLNVNAAVCTPPPANMIAWWKGEGNGNELVNGNNVGNVGTVNFVAGRVGQAFQFTGIGSYESIATNPPPLNITGNQVSLDGWIKPTTDNDAVYFGKTTPGANDYLLLHNFGQLSSIIKIGGTEVSVHGYANFPTNTVTYVPPVGQWTHIALTYDGATIKLYANAVQVGQGSASGNISNDGVPFNIGGRAGDLSFNGLVDEVEVFNRGLTPAEVGNLYTASTAGKCPAVVSTTGGPLNFGNVAYGATSAPQSYTVSGANLLGNININPPAGYEVSLTAVGGYGPSLSLTPTNGTVSSTQIFIHFVPSGAGAANGNVTNASQSATTQNIGATGTGVLGQFRSVQAGNWNSPSTWEISGDGGSNWSPPSISPTSTTADTITVRATHVVSVTAPVNADQVTVAAVGSLSVNNGITMTIDDGPEATDLSIADSGVLTANGEAVIAGAGTFANAANATLRFGSADGITSSACGAGATCGNIRTATRTFNGAASFVYLGSVNQVVGNGLPSTVTDLVIANSGGAGNNTVIGNGGQTVSGTLLVQAGVYESHSAYHDVIISAGATLALTNDISVTGNWTSDGTFTHNNHMVTFNGSTPQTISGSSLSFFDVTINNVTGVQLLTSMTVNGTLTLQNGQFDNNGTNPPNITNQPDVALFLNMGNLSTINRVTGTLTVAPNFAGEVDVTYSGSTPTTTGPELPISPNTTALRNLTINDAGGVTMSADATAHGLLSLTSADLNTGAFTLTMPQQGSTAGGFDVVGNAKRTGFDQAQLGTAMSFGNPFNRISIDGGTQPTDINVNLVKAAPGTFPTAVTRTYTITPSATGSIATVQLHYLDTELNGNNNEEVLALFRFNGSVWQNQGAATHSQVQNWVRQVGINSFSPWTISSGAPSAAMATVSGRIATAEGAPIEGATINLSGGQTRKTITDAEGNYRFDNVEVGQFYTVTPTRANFVFNPAERSFSLVGNQTDESFTGTAKGDNENPLDTPEYFVRQQYVDVLGREPDEGGFGYWSGQLNQCAGDRACMQARRVMVAAQFFISREFQDTGSYIYGVYQGALGRQPQFAEYSADRGQVVGGADMDKQKSAFARSFVQRPEFVTRYQSFATADQFVDALIANVQSVSGVDLTGRRSELINSYLGEGTIVSSRAAVLRAVADDAKFVHAGYNAAFVLTEYFAYLRRDPDQGGFDFWLGVLNNGGAGNYRGMVCSFVTSAEYQRRFSNIVTHGNGECAGVTMARQRARGR